MSHLIPQEYKLLINAFPGTGKSHLFHDLDVLEGWYRAKAQDIVAHAGNPANRYLLDSDSSTYDKSAFPDNYLNDITTIYDRYPYVVMCLSTHAGVLSGLQHKGYPHTVVIPDRTLKTEYLERYRERRSPEAFITLIDQQWDNFLTQCVDHARQCPGARLLVLRSGEYVSDVVRELVPDSLVGMR